MKRHRAVAGLMLLQLHTVHDDPTHDERIMSVLKHEALCRVKSTIIVDITNTFDLVFLQSVSMLRQMMGFSNLDVGKIWKIHG